MKYETKFQIDQIFIVDVISSVDALSTATKKMRTVGRISKLDEEVYAKSVLDLVMDAEKNILEAQIAMIEIRKFIMLEYIK